MKPNNLASVVVGGGIHGLTSAIALARKFNNVTLVEKNDSLLSGTSGSTHNRAHMGYHYPRSIETAVECLDGLRFFQREYPSALVYPEEAFYLVAKEGSKTTAEQFEIFCNTVGISYERSTPGQDLCRSEAIESGFKVREPIFDIITLASLLEKRASEAGVTIRRGAEVVGFDRKNGRYNIVVNTSEGASSIVADVVVNATYARANNTLRLLGAENGFTRYILQKTEVAVIKSKKKIPALTVMDGKFVSIIPLANTQSTYLLYDVNNSVVSCTEGFFFEDDKSQMSNFGKMIEHGKVYFPFVKNVEYVRSLHGSRPIRIGVAGDSRTTRLVRHSTLPVYSILEGKFISAPLIAERLIEKMRSDGIL